MRATLHVDRNSDRDVRCRFILVKVDGRQVGSMNFGQHLEIDLEPGRHEVVFDNTWTKKSLFFDVGEGDEYAIQIGNSASFLARLWMSVLAAFPTRLFVSVLRVDPLFTLPERREGYLS